MNKETIIGIFGKAAGVKLYQWLDPCCTTFCESVQSCGVVGPPGPTGLFPQTPSVIATINQVG